ncbi:tetratricopeptide repeat protein [Kribbella sp. NPDC056861]|uniref:tetratricopeptide repeat protein n=1 Tax=Kribbella sp. NPDC056861 TaxID=3154857 RepID=UPI00343CF2B7
MGSTIGTELGTTFSAIAPLGQTQYVDLYQVLQVSATADMEAVRSAVAKQRHLWVKRQTSADPGRRTEAEARVRDIDRAEQVLLDLSSRAAFDRERNAHRPSDADNPGAAHYATRGAIDAEAWFLRAHSSFLLGNVSDAGHEFTEAIRLRPDSALYHYGFAEALAAQEKWREALVEYEHALRLDPGNPEYRTSIAVACLQDEKADRAVELMEALITEFPETEVYEYYLGIALHDNALDALGQIKPFAYTGRMADSGGYSVVSEAQADWLERQAGRIQALRCKDPEIRRTAEHLMELATDARNVRWNLEGSGPWVGAFVLFGVLPFLGGLSVSAGAVIFGLIVGGLIAALFTSTRRAPVWKHKLTALTETGRLLYPGI